MPPYKRVTAIIAIVLILITALSIVSLNVKTGVIEGQVSIGPFSPVEPSSGSTVPPGTYSSRSLILTPSWGDAIHIPLNEEGFFSAEVKAGSYQVTISDCVFLGCRSALPRTVVIRSGEKTNISIDIDTGIR
jgi:hypothetical protein